ncbi:MAG: 30S ribosome-binding factor RbfA [Desulfocucumaceae bacterium]
MSHRPGRLSEAIKKEVSDILKNEIKDPRLGFVTITLVEVSGDLRYARVFVSVLGSEDEQKATSLVLERAVGYIRSEIGKRIRLRYTPEIIFKLDNSIERGTRIIKLMEEVKSGGDSGQ